MSSPLDNCLGQSQKFLMRAMRSAVNRRLHANRNGGPVAAYDEINRDLDDLTAATTRLREKVAKVDEADPPPERNRCDIKRYRVVLRGLKSRIIPDEVHGDCETLREAKEKLAAHLRAKLHSTVCKLGTTVEPSRKVRYIGAATRFTEKLAWLATASLPDLCPEEADEWHRRITGK